MHLFPPRFKARLVAAAACALAALGCAGAHSTDDPTDVGRVELALVILPGITLSTASYTLTRTTGEVTTGTVAVADSADVPVTLSGVRAGRYTLVVSGTASDGVITCSSQPTTVNIEMGATSVVTVHLTCAPPPGTGNVVATGAVHLCPSLENLGAVPGEAKVGGVIALSAVASAPAPTPAPLGYAWTASSGTLNDPSLMGPLFTCTTAGVATLSVALSDGDPTCTDSLSINVTCTAP
jgi:hypothetical protein